MTGYRRFIAYVYEYHKGKKGSNCGFIKVEVRDGRCRMEVHLQCPGLTPQVQCKVYGFVRNAGLMDGVLLGVCETGEGRAECTIETDAQNMAGSGAALGRIGGIILKTENGAFFGTEWDDKIIRPDNFREIWTGQEKNKTEKSRKEITEPEESSAEPKESPEAPEKLSEAPEKLSETPEKLSETPEKLPEAPEKSPAKPEESSAELKESPEAPEELPEDLVKAEPGRMLKPKEAPEKAEPEKEEPEKEELEKEEPEKEKPEKEELEKEEPEKEKPEKRPEKVSEIEKPADTQPGEEEKPETETAQEMRAQMEVESKLEKEYEKENNEMWETEKMNGNSPRLSEPDLEAQSVNDQEMQPASAREEQLVNAREMQPANGWDVRLQPDNTREMQKAPPEVNPAGNPSVPLKKVNSNRYTSYNRNTSHDRNTSQERSTPYKSAPYKRNPSRSPASVTFTFGEPYSPFSDGEIINCRKIHPKDLAHFSRRDCSLRNNRFLLYGYYNFGHLLVGTTASGQCILGVPGGYDQQERFMANMFGFPYFKECRQIELPKGRGGYWYRSINAPNTH